VADALRDRSGDALLPPELAMDEPPVSDEEYEAWAAGEVQSAEANAVALPDGWEPDELPLHFREIANAEYDFELAEHLMAKLAAVKAEQDADQAHLKEYVDRLKRWYEPRTKRRKVLVAFLEGSLTGMLRRLHEADPKKKSVSLPSGSITSTGPKAGNELVVEFDGGKVGQDAFIEWALAHGRSDMVQVEYKVLISDVREGVRIDESEGEGDAAGTVVADVPGEGGEKATVAVPGLTVRRKERSFSVKPGS
jgi:hypothetical protein